MSDTATKTKGRKTSAKTTKTRTAARTGDTKKATALQKKLNKAEKRILELEQELLESEKGRNEAEDRMLRVVAEFENAKRNQERATERNLAFARDRLLIGLLPLVDNVRRSARYEEDHAGEDSHQEGMRMIYEQMKKYLQETADIEIFEPLGQPFDPDEHEAMLMRPVEDEQEPGTVVEVFEAGYRSGKRILRAAKVVVGE